MKYINDLKKFKNKNKIDKILNYINKIKFPIIKQNGLKNIYEKIKKY